MDEFLMKSKGSKYGFLSQDKAAEEGEAFLSTDQRQHASQLYKNIWIHAACALVILMVGLGSGYGVGLQSSEIYRKGRSSLFWSEDLKRLEFEWTRLNGTIYGTNQYKGPPSPDLDAAWNRFTESEWASGTAAVLPATLDDIRRSSNDGSVETLVELGEENGGGYMAGLEMFHQIHCLNMLRKATHKDYYKSIDPYFNEDFHLQEHLDHCIDIIRQVLMCNSDTGLVMFHWVKKTATPSPDFNTFHQCRDPELVLQWAKDNAAPMTKHLAKPKNVVELDDWS